MHTFEKYPHKAGIYKLTCSVNGKIYIGKAVNIAKRLAIHKCYGNKKYGNCHFKRAVIKHGWESFNVEILEIFEDFDKLKDNDALLQKETEYIQYYDSINSEKGYNICLYGSDRTGMPHTEETKRKIREGNLGKFVSDETKEKLRVVNTGKIMSEDTRSKMTQKLMGNTRRLGSTTPEEVKIKISESSKGRVFSEEHRKKLSESATGRKLSKESKQKISDTRKERYSKLMS